MDAQALVQRIGYIVPATTLPRVFDVDARGNFESMQAISIRYLTDSMDSARVFVHGSYNNREASTGWSLNIAQAN